MEGKKLKALIFGSTGAIGRELVRELVESNKWSEVHVIARRELEQWGQFSPEQKAKIQVFKLEDLQALQETSNFNKFGGVDSVFCCLGTQQKLGKENFINVDFHYPQFASDIAKLNKIPHYLLVTSQGSNANSMFFYLKIKGQVEEAIQKRALPMFSVFRPGVLLNRVNDTRFGEKIVSCIPFLKKIECKDVAKALRIQAENNAVNQPAQQKPQTFFFENDDILKIARQSL